MKHLLKSPNIYTETHCGRDVTTTSTKIGDATDADCLTCLTKEAARLELSSKAIAARLTALQSGRT